MQLYSVTPRIVAADTVTEIAVRGNYPHTDLRTVAGKISVDGVCADGLFSDGIMPGYTCFNGFDMKRPMFEPIPATLDDDGVLRFKHLFRSTGEHTLHLRCGEKTLLTFSVFSVPQAYLPLRPYRGDMHLHSGYSGCCRERERLSPEYFAAGICANGYDFASLSDHKQHTPSLIAENFVSQCGSSFKMYPCEEVHQQDLHTIHMLNFGGKYCISDRIHPDDAAYTAMLEKYMQKVPGFTDHYLQYLAANWWLCRDLVNEAGGLAIYCHPFWRPFDRRFMPECIRDFIYEHRLYDALELFGEMGCDREDNDLNVARYNEQCIAEQRSIPIVGNSDAHAEEHLGINSTIVFAKSNDLNSLQDAIRAGMTVAVNSFPGEFPRTAGSLLLVNYFHYLRKNYYPRHDELCRNEADIMLAALRNSAPDKAYVEFINRPGRILGDHPVDIDSRRYAAETASAAAVAAARAELDREFWG